MDASPITAGLAQAEQLLLAEIHSDEGRAILRRLVDAVEPKVESQTANPFLRQGEVWAFSLVKGYLAPTAAAVPSSTP